MTFSIHNGKENVAPNNIFLQTDEPNSPPTPTPMDEDVSEIEDEYETSFSKLQKIQAKYGAGIGTDTDDAASNTDELKKEVKKKKQVRKSRGYGNSSVLESLKAGDEVKKNGSADDFVWPSNDGNEEADIHGLAFGDVMENSTNNHSSSRNFFMDDEDDDVNNDTNSTNYNAGSSGIDAGSDDDAEAIDNYDEYLGTSRGRSKVSCKDKSKVVGTNKELDENKIVEDEDEKSVFQETEDSGYGFSLGDPSRSLGAKIDKHLTESDTDVDDLMDRIESQSLSAGSETKSPVKAEGRISPPIDHPGDCQEAIGDSVEESKTSLDDKEGLQSQQNSSVTSSIPVNEEKEQNTGENDASTTDEQVRNDETLEAKSSEQSSSAANPDPSSSEVEPPLSEIFKVVDDLFHAADKDAVTVGDIVRSVADHFNLSKKVKKGLKPNIKARLTDLIQGGGATGDHADEEVVAKTKSRKKSHQDKADKKKKGKKSKKSESARTDHVKVGEEVEGSKTIDDDFDIEEKHDESDVGDANDSSSDFEVHSRNSKKKGRKASRKQKKSDEIDDGDSDSSNDSAFKSRKQNRLSKKRSARSRKSKSGKMAKHIRDSETKARRRQLEEARIRKEELGHIAAVDPGGQDEDDITPDVEKEEEKTGPQLSEHDRQRAIAIAARFDTNREEMRMKRAEDRVGLIDLLRQKRLESISLNDYAKEIKKEGDQRKEDSFNVNKHAPEAQMEEVNLKDEKEQLKTGDGAIADGEKPSSIASTEVSSVLDTEEGVSEDESDDDSEDELEIIGMPSDPKISHSTSSKSFTNNSINNNGTIKPKTNSTSIFDILLSKSRQNSKSDAQLGQNSTSYVNSRAALRSALRAKQIKASNRWLARELGYKTEEDHIRDCKEAEERKRRQIFQMEQQAALQGTNQVNATDEMDALVTGNGKEEEEDDEEMVMARELDQLEGNDSLVPAVDEEDQNSKVEDEVEIESVVDPKTDVLDTNLTKGNTTEGNEFIEQTPDEAQQKASGFTSTDEPGLEDETSLPNSTTVVTPLRSMSQDNSSKSDEIDNSIDSSSIVLETEKDLVSGAVREAKQTLESSDETKNTDTDNPNLVSDSAVDAIEANDAVVSSDSENPIEKKPKNSAWKAMLEKERAALSREKKRQRKGGGFVEGEAEEEEEDEGIAGLEDFGFSVVQKKKDDDEDDDVEVDDEDLEHVVDDVSDGEGDEEAGEEARKQLEALEEKERHKEIMRRMREGYDGRRGGIASGVGGARGTLRFDQLVAADNRDDAKRLGLLNDDELNSDDEGAEDEEGKDKKDEEDDDEAALLDRMLKERFLNRQDEEFLEETFSDDEEEEEEEGADGNKDGEDDEDKEQDRQAKRFAKRARMNRILEAYEGDNEFSKSRLIDEDESTQHDLRMIKTSLCRKRRGATGSECTESQEKSQSNRAYKKQTTAANTSNQQHSKSESKTESSFLSREGSLSLALMASRSTGRKRKTTFLSGKQSISLSRSQSCKSVSLNHVVFMASESQSASQLDSTSNSALSTNLKHGNQQKQKLKMPMKPRRTGSISLWSKVCSKNFK